MMENSIQNNRNRLETEMYKGLHSKVVNFLELLWIVVRK